ncbi:MAG TPA: hypothetical protein VJZ25_06320, partial [Gemmatimonadaceae bacterium]|nr:hypothetical protein [Gemmatimonadaceae bacterium]
GQSLAGAPVPCKGEVVTRIEIDASPPFRVTGDRVWHRAGRFAAKQHTTTKAAVIRRFLALQVGDRCTELRRTESERILRAQPFLADATVLAFPDGAGGVILGISTVDEISLIIGAGFSTRSVIDRFKLGEANLFSDALYLAGEWKKGAQFRDIWSGRFTDYQFLGRPYQLHLQGGRRELGSDWDGELSHPFLTDLQRLSWRTTAGNATGYSYFRRPNAQSVGLLVGRSYSDIGGVIRFGPPLGRLALLGGSLSFEDEDPRGLPILVTDSGIVTDTSTALIGRYTKHQTSRVNGLWGLRDVRFIRGNGFDALEGAQDLRTGAQLATLVGKGVTFLRGKEDDWFASTAIFAGAGSDRYYTALDISGEGRRGENGVWDGILAHGRGALYLKPMDRHTIVTDLTWSGGWRQRIPFQLTFADRDGGIRGFRKSDVGGARRLVARAEDRFLLARYKQVASFGIAGFLEAGKLWAGDSPFGVDTPLNASVGFSVLGAAPPQSRRMWRLDFAFPVKGDGKSWIEVRVTSLDLSRTFRVEPRDIYNSRARSVPSNVFNWP